jgi:hypothetical protein
MPPMIRTTLRWILILGSLFAVGPALAAMTGGLHDADGGHATTLLIGSTPLKGLGIGVLAFATAAAVAAAGARFFSLGTGLTCAGLVLAWARWGLGTIDDLVRRRGDGGDLSLLAIEGLAVALMGTGVGLLAIRLASAHDGGKSAATSPRRLAFIEHSGQASPAMTFWATVAVAAVVGGIITGIVAVTALRGQTLLAAVCGAIAAGAAVQLLGSAMRSSPTPLAALLGLALPALAAPIIARFVHASDLVRVVYSGDLLGVARPLTLDWAAGGLLGVPIGMGWAGATLDPRAGDDA